MKKLAGRLKRSTTGDVLVRRNPLLYGRMMALVERLDGASLEPRRAFAEGRLSVILNLAARTRYGRPYANKEIGEWPLLDRQEVRDEPMAFVHGPTWLGF